jgi:8-oxo-dGTP diphosphatase
MEKLFKIGCEVFITQGNKLLLGKRKNCYGAGSWALPGGHLEFGEKLVDAAKRELEEELGIKDANLELVTIVDDPREGEHYLHISFLLKDYQGEIKLMEPERCEGWEYFDMDKLPENFFPPHQGILDTFLKKKIYLY